MGNCADNMNNPEEALKELAAFDKDCQQAYDKLNDSLKSQGYRVKETATGSETNLRIKRVK